jgi:ribosomal protein L37AE/L43A
MLRRHPFGGPPVIQRLQAAMTKRADHTACLICRLSLVKRQAKGLHPIPGAPGPEIAAFFA